MQVLENISSKVKFYFRKLCPQSPRVLRIKHGIPFPPRPVVPSGNTNVTATIWYTLQRCVTLPMRETQPCCLSGRTFPSILSWYGARCESKANHCPSPHNTYPPLVNRSGLSPQTSHPLPSSYSNSPCRVGRLRAPMLLAAATDSAR